MFTDSKRVCSKQIRLLFGHPSFDTFFGCCLSTGSLVEIYGESAVGKTQFCLHLSLRAQLSQEQGGLGGKVAYICTEDRFPIGRLAELVDEASSFDETSPLDNIYIAEVFDIASQYKLLRYQLPILMKRDDIKLIIIDSIASNFRLGSENTDKFLSCTYNVNHFSRAKSLVELGSHLKKLANDYNALFICVNQITAKGTLSETPSLGMAWSNLVNSRVRLFKESNGEKFVKYGFSPCETMEKKVRYNISKAGVIIQ